MKTDFIKKISIVLAICFSLFAHMSQIDFANIYIKASAFDIYASFDDTDIILGDIDGDNKITEADARKVFRYSVGLETLTEEEKYAANIVKTSEDDNTVDVWDARMISRVAVKLERTDYLPVISNEPNEKINVELKTTKTSEGKLRLDVILKSSEFKAGNFVLSYNKDMKILEESLEKNKYISTMAYNNIENGILKVGMFEKQDYIVADEVLFSCVFDISTCVDDEINITITGSCEEQKIIFNKTEINEKYIEYRINDNKVEITGLKENVDFINIPAEIEGYPVTSIVYRAFKDCTGLMNVTIPDSVTSIGSNAFTNTAYYNNEKNWDNGILYINNHLIEADSKKISGEVEIRSGTKTIGHKAFWNCTGLTNIIIPDSLISIGEEAFYNCAGLTRINIPDSVTIIGKDAFCYTAYYDNEENWDNGILYINNHIIEVHGGNVFGEVEIKNGTKTIPPYAFENNTELTSIVIPDSVTSIVYRAFKGCTGLMKVTIPDSVTSIEDSAFENCTGLTSITISDSVTSIGESAFSGCSGLTNIIIPDNVTSIEDDTFYGCSRLMSIIIPDGVTLIGESAFRNCTGLTRVTIPDSVTSIGDYSFEGCTGLTNVTIPDNVTTIGHSAFEACTGLTSITMPESITLIETYTFSGCTGLVNVTIPDSVTKIESSAFSDCTGLTSIIIPDSVTTIEESAFRRCTELVKISIPDSVTSIGSWAFFDTEYYNNEENWDNGILYINNHIIEAHSGKVAGKVEIKSGIKTIPPCTFKNIVNLNIITIPDSVTSIGESAFEGCTGLTIITIPDSVTSIGKNAFYDTAYYNNEENWDNGILYINNHLVATDRRWSIIGMGIMYDDETVSGEVEVHDGTKTIASFAFYGCTGYRKSSFLPSMDDDEFSDSLAFTSIKIPDSVISIGEHAFADCTELADINIPDSVTSIGSNAFTNTAYYNNANNWDNGILYIDNHLVKAKSKKVEIRIETKSIAANAFEGCTRLVNITIPDSIVSIEESAFYGCSELTSITFDYPNTIIDDSENTISDTATIYGYNNSTAQSYAQKYNRNFVSLGSYILNHDHTMVVVKAKATTCTENGYNTHKKCSNCDYTEGYEEITATGHSLGDWIVITEATTEAEGLQTKVCSKCNAQVETDIINKLEITKLEVKTSESIKEKGGTQVVILPNQKASDIISAFNDGVIIKDAEGKEITGDVLIGSGFTVNLLDKDGNVIDTKIIIVPGDNDSDGKITAADARQALRQSVNLEKFNDWKIAASNLTGGEVTAADARIILRISVRLEQVEDIFKNH